MIASRFGRRASWLLAASLTAGCAANGGGGISLPPSSGLGNASRAFGSASSLSGKVARGHHTFRYSGGAQPFKVPANVTSIAVDARGASGGGQVCHGSYCYPPKHYYGRGGRVHAILPVRPGETIYVFVGGAGSSTNGGFNGGGNPGAGGGSYGGGGASDVREGGKTIYDRVLVAAGGGGQGGDRDALGGRGGGRIGGDGSTYCYSSPECIGGGGGIGGNQSQGGAGGAAGQSYEPGQPGTAGTLGKGGVGGLGGCYYYYSNCGCGYANGCPGAGGGGGYFGGGGGGGGAGEYASIYGGPGGGGGGGSSWVAGRVRDFKTWPGYEKANGDGLVVFSWN